MGEILSEESARDVMIHHSRTDLLASYNRALQNQVGDASPAAFILAVLQDCLDAKLWEGRVDQQQVPTIYRAIASIKETKSGISAASFIVRGGFIYYPIRNTVITPTGKKAELRPAQGKIFEKLLASYQQPVSYSALKRALGRGGEVDDQDKNQIKFTVHTLRQSIDDQRIKNKCLRFKYINTVRWSEIQGYILDPHSES